MIFYLGRSHAKSVVRLFAVSFLIEGFAKLALQTKRMPLQPLTCVSVIATLGVIHNFALLIFNYKSVHQSHRNTIRFCISRFQGAVCVLS